MDADRTFPVWAFLLSAGLRIGELVALRWPDVDLDPRVVRVVEFSSTIGYEVVASAGKSRDTIRTIDLDDQLVAILRDQRKRQAEERLATRPRRVRPRLHPRRRRAVPPRRPCPGSWLASRCWRVCPA